MKHTLLTIFISIACGAAGGFYAAQQSLARPHGVNELHSRISRLEQLTNERERADPLNPPECSVQPGLGASPSKPCHVTFSRLIQTPEKFHERWIVVTGSYSNITEENALYAPTTDLSPLGMMQHHSAVWIDPYIESPDGSRTKLTILGKFRNGPSGHLSSYFGTITNASVAEERTPGVLVGDNGIWIRPGSKTGDGPRIEIPGNGNKLPETLHY